ncbi:hypothetical protein RJ639_001620 [Escallonia herrerae]|uniref:Heat shock protein 70 n=1 Tax=Escallonia herrerae TaxID=1293975 RepID=A0AA89BNI5_9ASTE|nr:hypothetical protein RJ639_001620 [Escallonia herrerae]
MELSTLIQASISLSFITGTADGPKHIDTTLTREKFEELCSDLLDRLKTPVENSLRDATLSFKDLDEVILVGGLTRIPVGLEFELLNYMYKWGVVSGGSGRCQAAVASSKR